jgi:hypothetical protein
MTVLSTELKWYYSGGATNNDPAESYGGALSSYALASSSLNNLFDDVTGDEAESGYVEYRVLYFYNESTDANGLADPILWIPTQPPGDDDLAVAVATVKNTVITKPANDHTAPTGIGSFSAPATKGAGIALPSGPYEEDDYVGVVFRRTVPALATVELNDETAWAVEGDTV